MAKHGVTAKQIQDQEPCWQTAAGRIPLTIGDIERLISIDDPVAWAWLNLVERDSVRDEKGNVLIKQGDPWALFPVQAEMARIKGNLIIECGAEVGKTRDIVCGTLWEVDAWEGGANDLIAADSDITLEEIWSEIEYQIEKNPRIGGGLTKIGLKPFRSMEFANGSRFQMRLCGHDGKQFRGGHFSPSVRADEAAKWKNQQQFNELWRAGKPGSRFRIYSTPDGDYSSPFFALCDRAVPCLSAKGAAEFHANADGDEPRFLKFNITKMQLPDPFWNENRAAKYREQYGGENSIGWQTNVLGKWGSPQYSVFPMPSLKPCLKYLAHYRMVYAGLDRESGRFHLRAARLSPRIEEVDGGDREDMLARDEFPFIGAADLAQRIAQFFPEMTDWTDPLLYGGADLGSAADPSEFLFVRRSGLIWTDVFRLHLVNADWPVQAEVVAWLDHYSGHRVKYGFDNGSAGAALVQALTQMEQFRQCPVCKKAVYFAERLHGFNFGEHCDEIDVETGAIIPNPDKKDVEGDPMPHRLSNKEFSTRVLERKVQSIDLAIAHDAGAGDQKIAAGQLLVNHTSIGITARGERRFKATDDHSIDARRQVALIIASAVRGEPFIPADPSNIARLPREGGGDFGHAGPISDFSASVGGGAARMFGNRGGGMSGF